MKNKEKIYPEDVKLVKITKEFWQTPDGMTFSISDLHDVENYAKYTYANTTKCTQCKTEDSEYKGGLCANCKREKQKGKYYAIKETSSDFPVTDDDDRFFWEEEELIEYIEDQELTELPFLYIAKKRGFSDLSEENWTDESNEDGELPIELTALIIEFNEKLKQVPQYYWPTNVRYIPSENVLKAIESVRKNH